MNALDFEVIEEAYKQQLIAMFAILVTELSASDPHDKAQAVPRFARRVTVAREALELCRRMNICKEART